MEYSYGGYVRFAIIDKETRKAVGTIEIFAKKDIYKDYGKVGALRLDLKSNYETNDSISEIIQIVSEYFGDLFEINSVITKAISYATTRIEALMNNGFKVLKGYEITTYDDHFIKVL